MGDYWKVIELVSAVLDKLDQFDLAQFAANLFAGTLGALVGAYVGYRLASSREDRLTRLRVGIESIEQLERMEDQLGPDFVGATRRAQNNSAELSSASRSAYMVHLGNIRSRRTDVLLLYMRIQRFVSGHDGPCKNLMTTWGKLEFAFDKRNKPSEPNWPHAREQIASRLFDFRTAMEKLKLSLIGEFHPKGIAPQSLADGNASS
jgi:hypothetical protein